MSRETKALKYRKAVIEPAAAWAELSLRGCDPFLHRPVAAI
jgi:hypothetical protein